MKNYIEVFQMNKVNIRAFDPNDKWAWFNADLNGFIDAYMAIITLGIVSIVVFCSFVGATDCDIMTTAFKENVLKYIGKEYAIALFFLVTFIPPFLLVFVFRRNFAVIGDRRQFRYFCRWL